MCDVTHTRYVDSVKGFMENLDALRPLCGTERDISDSLQFYFSELDESARKVKNGRQQVQDFVVYGKGA